MSCFLVPEKPPVFCVLGRFGDIIQLLPAFKAVFDRTGFKPVVVVSREYASVLEGVSYVQTYVLRVGWYEGIPTARKIMQEVFGGGIICRWWDDSPEIIATLDLITNDGGIVLQSHGHNWGVDMSKAPDYGTSMWRRAGFTGEEMLTLPLVFDRRKPEREYELVKKLNLNKRTKPVLLYNFTGISSPFPFVPDILNPILRMSNQFHLVDLSRVSGMRIYDLLGLYDIADGLLTSDTATLHLAPASKVPYVALTIDGWTGSKPKGNCVLHVKYNESPRRVNEVLAVVEGWKKRDPAHVLSLHSA
jgi:hypothetical protein